MVEGARLESVYACKRIAGSNPVLSARVTGYLLKKIASKIEWLLIVAI